MDVKYVFILRENVKSKVFQDNIPKKISLQKWHKNEKWRRVRNEELCNLYRLASTARGIKTED